jgi:methyl-accepting chemotaxis protein
MVRSMPTAERRAGFAGVVSGPFRGGAVMAGRSAFGKKLLVSVAVVVSLTAIMGAVSVAALATVASSKDDVIASATRQLTDSQELSTIAEQRIGDYRAYLLNASPDNLTAGTQDRGRFLDKTTELRKSLRDPTEIRMLDAVIQAEAAFAATLDPIIERRKGITDLRNVSQLNASSVKPARLALQAAIANLVSRVQTDSERARKESSRIAMEAIGVVCLLGLVAIASAALIAVRLNRALRRQVGSAVSHIQSSSAQLQTTAEQQATGGRQQAGAMNEITTTLGELLITSRQIADNARRVSDIAEETAEAARSGDVTIDRTRQSIAEIRAQVDHIVQCMISLGEKSQQIGGVVDLVYELAEQTNILAINATIEASGAGEWGRRFAIVAEEIRKLADRTAGSAKEIRTLIDDVRNAVNTTVTATETGVKAVDSGVQHFDAAATSFQRIAELVSTTNDATREIELSTKQQTTAVEQVNTAASETVRVTRESESSAVQTRQTAAHLTSLSSELQELVGVGER